MQVIDALTERSVELTAEYTRRLDAVVNDLVPPTLSNSEYAARCSALLIAINRELARCAAAFCSAHGVMPEEFATVVHDQFDLNLAHAMDSIRGAGSA